MRLFLTWALCAALARAYVGGGRVGGPGWASGIAGAGADTAPVGRAKEAMEGRTSASESQAPASPSPSSLIASGCAQTIY
jgi:hypothetical protein